MMLTPLDTVLDRMVTLSRAMDQVLSLNGSELGAQVWMPRMDAWETDSAFVVQLDLPGVAPEAVEVSFERNTLTIRGKRPETIPAPDKDGLRVYANERPCGEFVRTIRFPQYVVGDGIQAQFANGVLTVTVPKADAAKPRKIAVMAAVEAKQVPGTQAVAGQPTA